MNQIAAVIQVARVAGVDPAGLPNLWRPQTCSSLRKYAFWQFRHERQERRIAVLVLGEAPRDRERERPTASTLSPYVPARLTCRALARRTGPCYGQMPCYAKGPLPPGKGPDLRKTSSGGGFEPPTSGL